MDIESNGGVESQRNNDTSHTIDDEDKSETNDDCSISEYQNDLHDRSTIELKNAEERLQLNILRFLINLKNNDATETCIDICAKDLINVLREYKELDVGFLMNKALLIVIPFRVLD